MYSLLLLGAALGRQGAADLPHECQLPARSGLWVVSGSSGRPRDEELAQLKRELARVKKERAFLREASYAVPLASPICMDCGLSEWGAVRIDYSDSSAKSSVVSCQSPPKSLYTPLHLSRITPSGSSDQNA